MKLYSKIEMIRNTLIGMAIGGLVVGVALGARGVMSKSATEENAGEAAEIADGEAAEAVQTEAEEKSEKAAESTSEEKIAELSEKYDALLSRVTTIANSEANYTIDEQQNIAVYEKCNEAVVNITTQEMAYNWFLEPVIQDGGSGSGSIIDKRGYVVTNVHVISSASKINISLADGSTYEGHVVGIGHRGAEIRSRRQNIEDNRVRKQRQPQGRAESHSHRKPVRP